MRYLLILFVLLLSCSANFLLAQSCRPSGPLQWIVADSIALKEMPTYKSTAPIYGLFFQKESDYLQLLDSNRHWQDISIQCKSIDFLPIVLEPYTRHYQYFELSPNLDSENEVNAFSKHLLSAKNRSYDNCILEYRIGRIDGCIEIDFSNGNGRYAKAFMQDSLAQLSTQLKELNFLTTRLAEAQAQLDEQRAVLWEKQMTMRDRLEEQRDLQGQFPEEISKHLLELSNLLDNMNYMKQIALREGLSANDNRIMELAKAYAQKVKALQRSRYAARIARPFAIYKNLIEEEHQLHQQMSVLQKKILNNKRQLGTMQKQEAKLMELQKAIEQRLK